MRSSLKSAKKLPLRAEGSKSLPNLASLPWSEFQRESNTNSQNTKSTVAPYKSEVVPTKHTLSFELTFNVNILFQKVWWCFIWNIFMPSRSRRAWKIKLWTFAQTKRSLLMVVKISNSTAMRAKRVSHQINAVKSFQKENYSGSLLYLVLRHAT